MIIEDVRYRVVFDSRGNETIECEVLTSGSVGNAMAPSGASTGSAEAIVVNPYRYEEIEEEVSRALVGMSVLDQIGIDKTLREIGGDNFSRIGGNFAITASLACAKAAANLLEIPLFQYIGGTFVNELPYPLGNVIGGGMHAEGSTNIQEFLVIPVGTKTFFDAQLTNTQVHKSIKEHGQLR
jgi:enolase